MDKKFVQERFARIRMAHGISARKLSYELGQSSEYINQIENGHSLPSLEGLFNFCDYFHLSLADFFEERSGYPVQYEKIVTELNKMDALEIEQIYELLRLINGNRRS